MKKTVKFLLFAVLIYLVFFGCQIARDKSALRNNVIRLHIVANSDSKEDQAVKMLVKDAIVSYLQPQMEQLDSVAQAKTYIENNLVELTEIANAVLKSAQFQDTVTVSFCTESFGRRDYDTFSLPSGAYESLLVEIGNGEGHNWWCVVFPTLCVPASTDGFQHTAVSSGFDHGLTKTLTRNGNYEIRFFVLDWLGKIENFLAF